MLPSGDELPGLAIERIDLRRSGDLLRPPPTARCELGAQLALDAVSNCVLERERLAHAAAEHVLPNCHTIARPGQAHGNEELRSIAPHGSLEQMGHAEPLEVLVG